MSRFLIGENKIEIWEAQRTIRTTFPDGRCLVAAPQDTEEYRRTMKELGYEDAWEMCKAHEILHTALAVAEGKKYSRCLWRAARNWEPDLMDYEEEARVMRLQKINNETQKINV